MSATTNRFELITLEKLQEIYDILSTSPPGAAVWGTITGTLSSQLDLQAALNLKYDASNPSGYTSNTGTVTSVALSAGTGISLSGTNPITTSGTITVTNSAPDQTVALTAGAGISTSGTYPNFTIATSGVTINKQTVTDGTAVTGTTANTLTDSILIPANMVAVGDILTIRNRVRKTGTAGLLSVRAYVNTTAAIGGSNVALSSNANTTRFSQMTRTLAVKTSTNTESFPIAGVFTDDTQTGTVVVSSNIDWTVDQYLVISVQNTSAADSTVSSFIQVQINKA